MAKPKELWVKAVKGVNHNGRDGEHLVLLFEFDSAHPTGEAFIAGPLPTLVGDTFKVRELLKNGDIEETTAPAAQTMVDPFAAERDALTARVAALEAELDAKAKSVRKGI